MSPCRMRDFRLFFMNGSLPVAPFRVISSHRLRYILPQKSVPNLVAGSMVHGHGTVPEGVDLPFRAARQVSWSMFDNLLTTF